MIAIARERLAEAEEDYRRLSAEHDVNSQTLARLQKELHTMQIRLPVIFPIGNIK